MKLIAAGFVIAYAIVALPREPGWLVACAGITGLFAVCSWLHDRVRAEDTLATSDRGGHISRIEPLDERPS